MVSRFCLMGTLIVTTLMSVTAAFVEQAQAQDAISIARRLPPGVQVLVRVPSAEAFKERWDDSAIGALQREEEMADVIDQLKQKWGEWSSNLEDEIGIPLDDLVSVPSGEIAFAVLPAGSNQIGMLGLLDFGDSEAVVDELIEKAIESLEDNGAEATYETIEGTEVSVFSFSETAKQKLVFCVRDNTLLIGSSVGLVESVLVRWDGESDQTFADNEVYQYINQKCQVAERTPLMQWYMDPIGLMTAAIKSQGQQNFQAQMMLSFLPSLGLNNFRAMGGAIDLAVHDYDFVHKVMLYAEPPQTGVLGLFHFPDTAMRPPAWVPDNAATYAGMNWDIKGAYASAEKLFDMFQGNGALAQVLDRLANEENGPKLHIKTDVIDLFSGRIDFFMDIVDPEDLAGGRTCVGFGLLDTGDQMKGVLDRIAQTPGFPGEVREFQGVPIYELPLPSPGAAQPQRMAVGVTKGYLFVTSTVELMEQVIREERASLAESENFLRVAEGMPETVSMIGFQRQDAGVQAIYTSLRDGDLDGADFGGFDFSALPEFEVIQKYLTPTGSYAIPDERGAVMVQFGLKPQE